MCSTSTPTVRKHRRRSRADADQRKPVREAEIAHRALDLRPRPGQGGGVARRPDDRGRRAGGRGRRPFGQVGRDDRLADDRCARSLGQRPGEARRGAGEHGAGSDQGARSGDALGRERGAVRGRDQQVIVQVVGERTAESLEQELRGGVHAALHPNRVEAQPGRGRRRAKRELAMSEHAIAADHAAADQRVEREVDADVEQVERLVGDDEHVAAGGFAGPLLHPCFGPAARAGKPVGKRAVQCGGGLLRGEAGVHKGERGGGHLVQAGCGQGREGVQPGLDRVERPAGAGGLDRGGKRRHAAA